MLHEWHNMPGLRSDSGLLELRHNQWGGTDGLLTAVNQLFVDRERFVFGYEIH